MSTPPRIAMIGAGAMIAAMLTTDALIRLAADGPSPISFSEWAAFEAPSAAALGALVLVGIYFGARAAAPVQRNGRFMKLVAMAHGVLGILLSLPLKTHAVLVDMPRAGGASAIPVLVAVVFLLAMVSGPLFVTLVLARLTKRGDA